MDSEEAEGAAAGAEARVLEEEEDGDGSGRGGRLDLRIHVFAPIAGEFYLTNEACLVFKQDALVAEHL